MLLILAIDFLLSVKFSFRNSGNICFLYYDCFKVQFHYELKVNVLLVVLKFDLHNYKKKVKTATCIIFSLHEFKMSEV